MHHLSRFAVNRPVAVTVLILVILFLGGLSAQRIGIDLLPDINFPVAVVVTVYPNAQPEVVEDDVTRPLEAALAGVGGIRRQDSFSYENVSAIIMQMDWNTNMIEAVDAMRSNLAQASLLLPSDAQEPVVARIDPNEFPLMLVGVSSEDLDAIDLSRRLEELQPLIEQVPGVAEAGLLGLERSEIEVRYTPEKLADIDITAGLLEQMITYQNMIVPGGVVSDDERRYNVRAGHRFQSIEELNDLIVGTKEDTSILSLGGLIPSFLYLSDVASVEERISPRDGLTRLNNDDAIMLRVMKQSGANTVQVASAVNEQLDSLQETYPDLNFETIVSQADFVVSSVTTLALNGLIGAALALMVLFLFLRNVHSLLIIGFAIPISVIGSFSMVYFGNLTLNLMTLGGLALGGGMLVDSSIVVLENIYRHRLEGQEPKLAAEKGSQEMASAIIASTTTTLAVFLPVIFMESIAGEIFKELGMTVSFSLFASLIVALTVVPMLSARMYRVNADAPTSGYGPLFSRLQRFYTRILEKVLRRKAVVAVIVLIAVGLAVAAFPQLGEEFLPTFDEGFLGMQASIPAGLPMSDVREIVESFEEQVLDIPEVNNVSVQLGDQGGTDLLTMIYGANFYSAEIQITLAPSTERRRSSSVIARAVQEKAEDAGFWRSTVVETSLFGSTGTFLAPNLVLEIRGAGFDSNMEIADELIDGLNQVPGVADAHTLATEKTYDLFLDVDPARSITAGLTSGQIGLAVRQATTGVEATELLLEDRSLPVVLRPDTDPNTVEGLMGSPVTSPIPIDGFGDQPVRLDRVTEKKVTETPPLLQRTDRRRVVNVTAILDGIDVSDANAEAQRILADMDIPDGHSVHVGGMQQYIDESQADLYSALFIAVFLVYFVMAAQFESFLQPLTIMVSVPLALVGAILALYLTGHRIGVTSLIGMIILTGIVVNNAIVLVDYINRQRRRGFSVHDAVIRAARIRLRPILMTAITTILGLVPLAIGFGEGSEIQVPLAIAVIGGLITATLLTLFVIPAAYTFIAHVSSSVTKAFFDRSGPRHKPRD